MVDVIYTPTFTADVTAPTISLTAPAAGNVAGSVNVTATAADNIGVAGVQFLLNGANLGTEVLTAPYATSWNTASVANGTYTLTARARDAAGNTTTSTGVVVTVNNVPDTQAPSVSMTAPSAGTVSGAAVSVSANATDNVAVAGVQFLLNGVNLGAEDVSSPFTVSWNTLTSGNGVYTLTARARDAAGNTTTSAGVVVTVSNSNNLILAMPLNEGTGTVASDISGNNHPGTLTSGPTWTTGKYGQGVSLNGTSNYINIPDHADFSLDPAQNYTWSTWLKCNSFSEWSTVWSQTLDGNNFFYFYAHTSTDPDGGPVTNGLSVYWWANGGTNKIGVHSSNNVLTAGQWSHVTVTYDASQAQNNRFTIYVNGVDVTVRTDVSSTGTIPAINPANIRIGSNQPFGEYLNGSVDEVRFYRRLLSVAEVQTDMNSPLAPDVTNPVVSMTAPAAGTVSGTVNVTANATDNVGVAGVQFLLNGVNLGTEDVASPYSISWNTATSVNGTYTLTARARDAAGNITTSAGVSVTINNDTQLPVTTITAPAAGQVLGTINVTADATDNTGVVGVQFLLDGVNLGSEDLVAPYSVSWNTTTITDGSHTLTARARDAAGNLGTSVPVVVSVLNNPPDVTNPVVSITAPAAAEVSGTVNVTANATDNVSVTGVQFLLNGANLGSEDLSAPYSVSWNTIPVTNGTYTLTARARDAAGNITTSAGVVVTVNNIPDTQAPTVSITSPAAGTVTGTINVNANAADNIGVTGVQFLLNGTNLGAEDVSAPYTVSWNTVAVINGNYTLTARARDAAGNITTSAAVNVIVNNNTNLIASINFNEGSGTLAADISGNSHNGTLTNAPTWGAGKYGQGVNLDGTNDYVNIADHNNFTLDPAQSYTWSTWLKCNNFNEWSTVWSQTLDGSNFFYFYAHTSSDPDGGPVTNGLSVYWWGNGGSNKIGVHTNNNVLTAGQWSYVTVTYDASQPQNNRFTIYVNAVDVTARGDVSSTGTITAINPSNIRIGSNQPFGEYLNGSIDEVRFYKRLLTSTEVLTDMNSPIATGIVPTASPVNGATGVAANAAVTVTFNVAMDATTVNSSTIELRNAANVLVPSSFNYNATTRVATITPSSAFSNSSLYAAKIKGGTTGVKDLAGNTLATDYNWSFTTVDPPLLAPTEGPGGPILVVSSTTNSFSRYAVEILRAEGLNQFAAADVSTLTATLLNNYDVVVLGEMTVTAAQVTLLTNWVNAGGTLIAFKPSALLTPLMGISGASGTLTDKYLLVNTATGPGAGIVNQTIQFHGVANLHTLSGATSLAALYSAAGTATSNPAVTTRSVGANGGTAVAFTYDLAKSIIYTRQGNPAWAGQKRDGQIDPVRSDDMFFPDWVDFNKIAIPQADEQQRLPRQHHFTKQPSPQTITTFLVPAKGSESRYRNDG
ncbi:MAG: Ig-like domain-containing protein [Bacteroidota bacterium]